MDIILASGLEAMLWFKANRDVIHAICYCFGDSICSGFIFRKFGGFWVFGLTLSKAYIASYASAISIEL